MDKRIKFIEKQLNKLEKYLTMVNLFHLGDRTTKEGTVTHEVQIKEFRNGMEDYLKLLSMYQYLLDSLNGK